MIKNYKNSEDLLKKIEPNSGEWLKGDDKGLLQLQFEEKTIKFGESKTEQVELHVYDLNGNLLASNHDVDDWQVTKPESEGSNSGGAPAMGGGMPGMGGMGGMM